MGQFFRVNGDYNIKAKDGGTIIIDAGDTGNINVVGNLTVSGDLTSISSNDIEIKDRIIVLNKDETGPGVSLRYSGIEIDRGPNVDDVANYTARRAFVFDETTNAWIIVSGSDRNSSYGFGDSNLKVRKILTDAGTDSGDLTLIGTGTGVVKVAGTTNYRLQVTDNDDIPNKDYVDYSILNNPTFQIRAPQSQDTRVIIADRQVTPNNSSTGGSLAYYQAQTGYPVSDGTESGIGFIVDSQLTATFFANRVQLQDLEIFGSEIRHDNSNANIFINTNGTGKLQTNYGIQLDNNPVSPGMITGSHVIYSKPESTGKSGLFFVNTENNRDELVSKNRALLFSMLF